MVFKFVTLLILIIPQLGFSIGHDGPCSSSEVGQPCTGQNLCTSGGTYQNTNDLNGNGTNDCACRCSGLIVSPEVNKLLFKSKSSQE
jgi:hypothetical protein